MYLNDKALSNKKTFANFYLDAVTVSVDNVLPWFDAFLPSSFVVMVCARQHPRCATRRLPARYRKGF
jgi:hypothetical protein